MDSTGREEGTVSITNDHFKVGLLTPYSGGNLGDGAIQDAVIWNIRKRIQNVVIYGITLYPEDTKRRHDVLTFPLCGYCNRHYVLFNSETTEGIDGRSNLNEGSWKKVKRKIKEHRLAYLLLKHLYGKVRMMIQEVTHIVGAYNLAKELNLIVVSGGGQLDEYWGGPWGHPYVLFKWAMFAKMTRCRFIMLSVGKSSLDSMLSRFFVKWALKLSAYRSYRDEVSKKLLNEYAFTTGDPVFPDLVFSLPIPSVFRCSTAEKGTTLVGVSPIAYCDPRVWPRQEPLVYESYVRKLASFISWLTRNNYKVLLFSTDEPDRETINDLLSKLAQDQKPYVMENLLCPPSSSVNELLSCLSRVDFVVASRLHGVKISHMLSKPTLAISYERKVSTYMSEVGLEDYCLDIDDFDLDSITAGFTRLLRDKEKITLKVKNKADEYEKSLEKQYENIFAVFCIAR